MTFRLGLTGSIGMGKSTTAAMFSDLGCAVWDADAAVHRLYDVGGAAVAAIGAFLPDAIVDGAVSRDQLKAAISTDPDVLKQIEGVVHPLVAQDRAEFLRQSTAPITVFDIPLLFETGADQMMDAVACVWVDADVQRQRVMDRGTMSIEQFQTIKSKQMPIEDKRARSHYHIHTDTMDHARDQVRAIVAEIKAKLAHA